MKQNTYQHCFHKSTTCVKMTKLLHRQCLASTLQTTQLLHPIINKSHNTTTYYKMKMLSTTTDQQCNRQQSILDYAKQYGSSALVGKFPHRPNRYDSMFSNMIITDIDTQQQTATAELTITEELTNSYNTLHGGCTASLVDVMGTLALLAANVKRAGVSLDINISYLSAIKIDDTIVCVGRVLKAGKTIGHTQVDIYNKSDNKLVATGRHTKYL